MHAASGAFIICLMDCICCLMCFHLISHDVIDVLAGFHELSNDFPYVVLWYLMVFLRLSVMSYDLHRLSYDVHFVVLFYHFLIFIDDI